MRPPVPQLPMPTGSTNPIDAFIAAKHAELKLTPVGETPPNLLLRRLYLDLIGLPPTVEDLDVSNFDSIRNPQSAIRRFG